MRIKKGFIMQKNGSKITIFDGENSQLITFNETATFIFERIKRGIEKERIIQLMIKKYNTTPEIIENDMQEILAALKKMKIIS